jgi:hypothetical protein
VSSAVLDLDGSPTIDPLSRSAFGGCRTNRRRTIAMRTRPDLRSRAEWSPFDTLSRRPLLYPRGSETAARPQRGHGGPSPAGASFPLEHGSPSLPGMPGLWSVATTHEKAPTGERPSETEAWEPETFGAPVTTHNQGAETGWLAAHLTPLEERTLRRGWRPAAPLPEGCPSYALPDSGLRPTSPSSLAPSSGACARGGGLGLGVIPPIGGQPSKAPSTHPAIAAEAPRSSHREG